MNSTGKTLRHGFRSLVLLLMLPASAGAGMLYDSSYTALDEQSCKTLSLDEESGSVTQRCPGFGNFGVLALEGDLRQSITLIRDGREYPLDFWSSVTPAFSSLGKLMEWRHHPGDARRIVGMIVRLNVSEDPDRPEKTTSYLVVTKITETEICVVGKLPPQRNQNSKAREMADFSAALPCVNAGQGSQ